MVSLAEKRVPYDGARREDHIVHLRGATWGDYQRLLDIRGDKSAPRIAYLKGVIEIMSPSRDHEHIKSAIGRLVEAYLFHADIDFTPVGSWTLEDKDADRGVEPDECYVFGLERTHRPHLAIEVIWTSGGIDKLEIYRKLGVGEVWFWRQGGISVHVLRGEHYLQIERSEALPELDLEQLMECMETRPVSRAVRRFRETL